MKNKIVAKLTKDYEHGCKNLVLKTFREKGELFVTEICVTGSIPVIAAWYWVYEETGIEEYRERVKTCLKFYGHSIEGV